MNTPEFPIGVKQVPVVPVLVLESVEIGLKMCELLCQCALPVAEITFRTERAAEIIEEVVRHFPEMLIGAGTLLSPQDVERAQNAGAQFGVAPGFNPTVVRSAMRLGLPFAPGVCTPSELEQAYELGCRVFKFFPAEASGGVGMLKAMSAPYRHLKIKWMPTGGITPANAASYLAVPEVIAVGGTWLGKSIPDWEKVRQTLQEAVQIKRGN